MNVALTSVSAVGKTRNACRRPLAAQVIPLTHTFGVYMLLVELAAPPASGSIPRPIMVAPGCVRAAAAIAHALNPAMFDPSGSTES